MCDGNYRPVNVNDVFETLCRTLSLNGNVNEVSNEFHALNTNVQRVELARTLLRKYRLTPTYIDAKKDEIKSVRFRQDGNDMFKNKKDQFAWALYTKSIAYAPINSETLGLAYANRSAVLFQKHLYAECLEDIDHALNNNYPSNLNDKLLQRQMRAKTAVAAQKQLDYFEKLPFIMNPNPLIHCASDVVEINYTENLGRHVVATKDIKIGDVLAIENPFARILLKDSYLNHCFYCFKASYTLIPCMECTFAMFCSDTCRNLAWDEFHVFDCPIMMTLHSLCLPKLTLLALRVCLCAKDDYDKLNRYKQNKVYKSGMYEEIHKLADNGHLRNASDLFPRAVTAAIIFEIVKNETCFFGEFNHKTRAKDTFKDLLLKHMQTGPTNFHEISELAENKDGVYVAEEIGAGAYSFLSLLNHSCSPNVIRHCHGYTIVLRALRPIQKGQQLFDNYGYHHALMKKVERQSFLKNQYFFECKCEACEFNWPLYHQLPIKQCYFELDNNRVMLLKRGDSEIANQMLNVLIAKATIIETIRPCKNLADIQETIKQCFAIFGNKRPQF